MEQILLDYLKNHTGEWIKKVALFVISDTAGYSPETCGRTLRELSENGRIEVGYYDGKYAKHLAKYSYKPEHIKTRKVKIINDVPHLIYE